jgi:hypothetical protein
VICGYSEHTENKRNRRKSERYPKYGKLDNKHEDLKGDPSKSGEKVIR